MACEHGYLQHCDLLEEITELKKECDALVEAGEVLRDLLEDCSGKDRTHQPDENAVMRALQQWLHLPAVAAHLDAPPLTDRQRFVDAVLAAARAQAEAGATFLRVDGDGQSSAQQVNAADAAYIETCHATEAAVRALDARGGGR